MSEADTHRPSPAPADATPANSLTRRKFMRSGAVAGSALYLATNKNVHSQGRSDDLNVAIVGAGAQGIALRDSIYKDAEDIGFKFVAVCDIWEYNGGRMAKTLQKYGHPVKQYVDIEDMLAKDKSIDAVMIATPDFMHAPHTIASLETANVSGVYCEKMMSNTLEAAKSMVVAQQRTGKLLQIGHQRRSNPRYLHARNEVIRGHKMLGRVTHAYGQWNRAVSEPIGAPEDFIIDDATLAKYGYGNMHEFRNWRMFERYGGGVISDLGAHQIDIFNWVFDTLPKAVVASGGRDYYESYELPDNVLCVYEYETPEGTSRANYQVLTTTSSQGFYEKFMGVNGSVSISEVPTVNQAYREAHAPDWKPYAAQGLVTKILGVDDVYNKVWEHPKPWTRPSPWLDTGNAVDLRGSAPLDPYELPIILKERPHNPHIRNFLTTVKNGGKQEDLNCPVIEAYKTCVSVLKVYDALENGGRYEFKPEDFAV